MIIKNRINEFFAKTESRKFIWNKLHITRAKFFLRFNSKVIANKAYKSAFKKDINWENPINFMEKIQWLQIYSDTSLWTICADKYLVRAFVKERGCEEVLNELYGMWYNPNDIDWSMLPNSFVLKANHSCGQVILVEDKNKLDKNKTNIQLRKWMKSVYGIINAQLHYTKIKPCIIAEKLFVNKKDPDKSLIDYKIYCFHGIPECVIVVYNRTKSNISFSLYDLEWNDISDIAFNEKETRCGGPGVPKPLSLGRMIEVAKKLSKGFPQVRVDFYDIDDEAVFGEMTFTTGYPGFTDEYFEYLGNKIDLSKVVKLPKPNSI